MKRTPWISLLTAAAVIALAPACKRAEPSIETKSETKSTNPDGSKTTTSTETKQVGSTVASTTETNVGGPNRGKIEDETVVGTVTDFGPGKRIVVLTGDGARHTYDLDEKNTSASVDRSVAVGTKVRLDATKAADGRRAIRVIPVADR
ncbi:MAG TPA: hypothetical protein VGQ32_02240 [Thermoanaerobaculia bacterium]|nr:hypothetical protein [Thermoanaerobaculia bacterium]